MPSQFTGFDVKVTYVATVDGEEKLIEALVPNAPVEVRDITNANPATGVGAVALPDLQADAAGHVAAGQLAIAAGRTVRFGWFRDTDAACGFAEQVTTEV